MGAEEAVKSLSEQLSAAEKRAGGVSAPIVLSDTGAGGTALIDPITGLLNQEYFVVALDSRIAAARRHLRPVAVGVIQVVDGREGDNRPNAEPALVAQALRATLREADTLTHLQDGRFGMVPETAPKRGAILTMERFHLHLKANHPSLTLWVGVACCPGPRSHRRGAHRSRRDRPNCCLRLAAEPHGGRHRRVRFRGAQRRSLVSGGMAERTIALVLKTSGPSRVPGVRIPLPPPPPLRSDQLRRFSTRTAGTPRGRSARHQGRRTAGRHRSRVDGSPAS